MTGGGHLDHTAASYLDFIGLVDDAALVITDSGGLQEETSYLGVDCLTFRENTERPVTVLQGTNRLVAPTPTPCCARRAPCSTMGALPQRPARAAPFLDGQAAGRIVGVLHNYLLGKRPRDAPRTRICAESQPEGAAKIATHED